MGNPNLRLVVDNTDSDSTEDSHEPQITWEAVYYADGIATDEALRRANRRQEAWESDPEEYNSLSIEAVDGWLGECAG